MQKIYLAGPEVFLPNATEVGKAHKHLCQQYGYEGLFPLDNTISGNTPKKIAEAIRQANEAMIRTCDIVIANLSPFRGPEPDSGTVWEVGFAQGLGKKVIAYSTDLRTHKEKTQSILNLGNANYDALGMAIEDFGLTHNLMFSPIVIANSFEASLQYLAQNGL
ncbi:nucleoside 2-deoxyribosyltransferase [Sulfurospirillum diekertiae]|uniref:Nucleoside 2-deoxyribosyltransferase n=1 Tax=Sulfurospirillum diekertiae TaxID=1854492 RepID=A0A6G9VSI4_9BACT|nr:nucleoside 2-deoxyribosyltransferase [Sulfurospirillum diekertiae]QIR75867.1 nucleoside 2-deoxyribosyltransferase [Sulfurospirillum diekertiae]QIR78506.1 nucleoside 2-deoxyribosyltransferase [Sulfurospirillum diekertiae]